MGPLALLPIRKEGMLRIFLNRKVARIPRIYSALNLFLRAVLICWFVPNYFNFAASSKDRFAIFMVCFVLPASNVKCILPALVSRGLRHSVCSYQF
jgi:hypothetical protein